MTERQTDYMAGGESDRSSVGIRLWRRLGSALPPQYNLRGGAVGKKWSDPLKEFRYSEVFGSQVVLILPHAREGKNALWDWLWKEWEWPIQTPKKHPSFAYSNMTTKIVDIEELLEQEYENLPKWDLHSHSPILSNQECNYITWVCVSQSQRVKPRTKELQRSIY